MKSKLRWLGIAGLILLTVVVALPLLIDANRFRPMLESELTSALARGVKVGDLKLAILSTGVTAADLSIAEDPAYGGAPFLHTGSVKLGVSVWPLLFSHELHVTELTLDQPQIELIQSAAGDWNVSTLGGKSSGPPRPSAPSSGAPLNLSVKLVRIVNGRLNFTQQGSHAQSRALDNVNVELRDFSATSSFPFHLTAKLAGSGDLQLDGTAGPINSSDAAQTPAKVKVKLAGVNLAAAQIEGLAGLLSIDGVAASNGRTLFLNGRLKADQLKLSKSGSPAHEPVEFDFALEHDMRRHTGVLRSGAIHIGSAPANLTGSYAPQGDATAVNMTLSGPAMPVPQLAGMLPALGVVLPAGASFQGGMAGANLNFAGTADALVTSGNLGLSNTRLAGFDLGSKISGIEKMAGIKTGPDTTIQTFIAKVRLTPEGSMIDDIHLVAPALGELSGAGTVSATQALDFKMRATLHTGGAALALIGAKSGEGIPFVIEGTASNPVFRPDVKAMATQKVEGIEKGTVGKVAGGLGGLLGKKK